MKKCILFIMLIIIFNIQSPIATVNATEYDYAMVISKNAVFYSDASCRFEKFILPYSYYVKVVSIGSQYSRVLYMDNNNSLPQCEGYVSNADLDFSLTPSENPYPSLTLTAKYDEVIFGDLNKEHPLTVIQSGTKASFYGSINYAGETYLYVYTQGFVGYVRQTSLNDFELKNHKDIEKLQVAEDSSSSSQINEEVDKPSGVKFNGQVKIVIVAVVLILSLCLIYFILRPDKKLKGEHSFFGDKDEF